MNSNFTAVKLLLAAIGILAGVASRSTGSRLSVSATSDYVLLYGARYNMQPSRAHVSHRTVAAFDFPGATAELTFTRTSELKVVLYWYHATNSNKTNQPHRFWATITSLYGHSDAPVYVAIDTSAQPGDSKVPFKYTLFDELDPSATYTAKLTKITESNWNVLSSAPNFVELHQFQLHTWGTDPPRPLSPPNRRFARRIEFIGDSLTCGFCNMCHLDPSLPPGYAQESFGLSWAQLVCNFFGADCHTEAWSGYGVYRNCCGGNTTMPVVLNRTLGSDPSSTWDFRCQDEESSVRPKSRHGQSTWPPPNAVVINLGTNDHLPPPSNTTNNATISAYTALYMQMLRQLATFYTKNVVFFLACGPMLETYCNPVHTVLAQAAAEGLQAHFLDQRNTYNTTNLCCFHPDAVQDRTLAGITIPVLQRVLHW